MEIRLDTFKNLVFSLPGQMRASQNKHPIDGLTSREEIRTKEHVREEIKEFLKNVNTSTAIKMHYDEDIDRVIVTIIDSGTEKVIRQIPPEEFVAFVRRFRECLSLIFERRV